MKRKFYKELWSLRFAKMLQLEKNAVEEYETMLFECRKTYNGHSVEPHLERLIADEQKHVKLVEELNKILEKDPYRLD